MLKVLGLIVLGLVVFVGVTAAFIAGHVLGSTAWQLAAVSVAAFVSAFVVAAIDPRHAWEHAVPVVVAGILIFLRQGLRHFMSPSIGSVAGVVVLGLVSGALGAWLGSMLRAPGPEGPG